MLAAMKRTRCDSTSSFRHRLFECEHVASAIAAIWSTAKPPAPKKTRGLVLQFVKAPLQHVADQYDADEPALLDDRHVLELCW